MSSTFGSVKVYIVYHQYPLLIQLYSPCISDISIIRIISYDNLRSRGIICTFCIKNSGSNSTRFMTITICQQTLLSGSLIAWRGCPLNPILFHSPNVFPPSMDRAIQAWSPNASERIKAIKSPLGVSYMEVSLNETFLSLAIFVPYSHVFPLSLDISK